MTLQGPPQAPIQESPYSSWVDDNGHTRLLGSQCVQCRKHLFPPTTVCDKCGSQEMKVVTLSGLGTLYSFTEIHVAPRSFKPPYVVGYADLEEGVRVFAQIDHSAAELKVDEPVEACVGVIRTLEDGTEILGYKFRKRRIKR